MADLKKRIADILKDSDLKTTTAKKVRNQLEEETGLDISLRIEEIDRIMQEVMDETTEEKEIEEIKEIEEVYVNTIWFLSGVPEFWHTRSVNLQPDIFLG